MAAVENHKHFTLPDGRSLGFAEYGDLQGKPLFFFHGFPSSRLEAQFTKGVAGRLGARIIAIDRPGFGRSDLKKERRVRDWPDDVLALADALGIDRFAVLGVSGGGPYAAACAHTLAHRLTAAGIVCGLGPLDVPGITTGKMRAARLMYLLARPMPGLVAMLYRWAAKFMGRHPERMLFLMKATASEPDRRVLRQPPVRRVLSASYRESFRQGPAGAERELWLYGHSWGFRLEDISMPVHIWHGEKDRTVPVSMGRHFANTIPDSRAEFFPDEGHFSLPILHMEKILRTLM